MKKTVVLLGLVALSLLLTSGAVLALSPEDLDSSFDGDGRIVTDFSAPEGPGAEGAYDVIVQPDGKIVAGGFARTGSSDDVALARYNPDGSPDTSFDSDGKVTTDIAGGNDRILALGVQSDGKIVAVGSSGWDKSWMVRYGADGSLDTSFDEDGKVSLNLPDASGDVAYVEDLAVQEDGKIVVAGNNDGFNLALARYTADGALDTSFGGDGKVSGQFDRQPGSAKALAIQPDGKIVVVGIADDEHYTDTGIARYNTDGSLDNSFAGDGTLATSFTGEDDEGWGVAIQPNGKIVVAVDSYQGAALRRFKADGSLDKTFGDGGTVLNTAVSGYSDLAIQENGKIVAQNSCPYCFRNEMWGVTRHNPGGSIDSSLRFRFGWGEDEHPGANAMALQPDGKVVLAGGLLDDEDLLVDFRLTRHMGAFQDDTKPTGSVTIDGGRRATNDRTVQLTLEATDPEPNSSGVSRMRIKNAGSDWTKWSLYEPTKTWKLSRGAGSKTVFVQYKDLVGNVSDTVADSINYRP
jgi:uncharacterized delta-60 repeat protein